MLTLDYRPTMFSDMVGQTHVTAVLSAFAAHDDLQAACLMFAGPRGTGKTSAARILAAALNCENAPTTDACMKCDSCIAVQSGSSATVLEVDAASNGGVDDIHRIRDLCLYAPLGRIRVVILDEAQSLTHHAQNALLSTLETPPERTVFLLLTTQPDKIQKPVRSRAMSFEFRPIPAGLVAQRLTQIAEAEKISVPQSVIERIALDTSGYMREAVMLLDQVRLADVDSLEAYEKKFSTPDLSVPIFDSLTRGDLHTALDHVRTFFEHSADLKVFSGQLTKTLLAMAASVSGASVSGPVAGVAQRVTHEHVLSALHVLWDFSGRIQWAPSDRTLADLAVVMLGKVLAPNVIGTVAPQSTPILTTEASTGESADEDPMSVLREQGLL